MVILLKIFFHCRLGILEGDGSDTQDIDSELLEGGRWRRERWWYKRAQVCQRWRHLTGFLASPSHSIPPTPTSFPRLYVWVPASK